MQKNSTRSRIHSLARMIRAGFDFLIPAACMGCGAQGSAWCDKCAASLKLPSRRSCPDCGLPRSKPGCPACSLGIGPLSLASIASYTPPLSNALVAFKYRPERAFADIMGAWLEQQLRKEGWKPDMIIPVPLSKVRFKERGYNQVELITSALARSTAIPHKTSTLLRVRDTRSQVGLDPSARFGNVHGVFAANSHTVSNAHILLVDDLVTSGATILACCEALFASGAEEVFALTIARA